MESDSKLDSDFEEDEASSLSLSLSQKDELLMEKLIMSSATLTDSMPDSLGVGA